MSDEIAKLKVELEALNLQCQLARDHEIRYALQRTRLETGRMQLMLKIVDAMSSAVRPNMAAETALASSPQHVPAPKPSGIGNVVVAAVPAYEKPLKPDGLPTVADMVLMVLEDAGSGGLRPPQVTRVVRKRWWPDIPDDRAAQTMWNMAKAGRLRKHGHRYKLLNGHAG
jgi:hypothetical protein